MRFLPALRITVCSLLADNSGRPARQKVCMFGMSRRSCPPVTSAAPPRHMTLEPYWRLAAFGAGAAELMLRQTAAATQRSNCAGTDVESSQV